MLTVRSDSMPCKSFVRSFIHLFVDIFVEGRNRIGIHFIVNGVCFLYLLETLKKLISEQIQH